jgi:hypothetical protein
MARLAEMGVTPAKPLGGRTTVFAFEFDVVFAMLWTVLDGNLAAVLTYQLLGLKTTRVLLLTHCLSAIFTASEVWIFAFKAFEVCIDCNCILLWLLIIWRLRIFELFILITPFKLKSFNRHLFNFVIQILVSFNKGVQLAFRSNTDPFLTKRA